MSQDPTPSLPINEDFIRTKWLPALRSGEYPQAKGNLRVDDEDGQTIGYCCLGVVCDIIAREQLIEGATWEQDSPSPAFGITRTTPMNFGITETNPVDFSDTALPPKVVKFLGISPEGAFSSPVPDKHGVPRRTLTMLNDHGDMTFSEIADAIEQALDDGGFSPVISEYHTSYVSEG